MIILSKQSPRQNHIYGSPSRAGRILKALPGCAHTFLHTELPVIRPMLVLEIIALIFSLVQPTHPPCTPCAIKRTMLEMQMQTVKRISPEISIQVWRPFELEVGQEEKFLLFIAAQKAALE